MNPRPDATIKDATEVGVTQQACSPTQLLPAPLGRCILIVKDSASSDGERENGQTGDRKQYWDRTVR